MIEILQSGLFASIQDLGRNGMRQLGIPRSGVLVPSWMKIANALVGNPLESPVIEFFEGGLMFNVGERAVRIAIVGNADVYCTTPSASLTLLNWRSHLLSPGSTLRTRSSGNSRVAVMAIQYFQITPHHGSCATYAKAGLGGIDGRPLHPGLQLEHDAALSSTPELCCRPIASLPNQTGKGSTSDVEVFILRAVPGPQDDAFTVETLDAFFSSPFTLTTDADRMGARFDGTRLTHIDRARQDIVSDAIVPGSVQIPGNGLPIVLLADSHTVGGYPKIATVISTDLPLLGMLRPGAVCRFERVSVEQGITIARQAEKHLQHHLTTLVPVMDRHLDVNALLTSNLIDGVTDGEHFPE